MSENLVLPPELLQLPLLVTELRLATFAPLLGAAQLEAPLGVLLRQLLQATVRGVRPGPDELETRVLESVTVCHRKEAGGEVAVKCRTS